MNAGRTVFAQLIEHLPDNELPRRKQRGILKNSI
jgi:hypothetical protein